MKKKQHGKLYLFMGVLLVIVAVLGIFFKSVQPENEAHKETVRLAKKYAHLKSSQKTAGRQKDYECRNGYEGKNSRLGSYLSERLRQFVL